MTFQFVQDSASVLIPDSFFIFFLGRCDDVCKNFDTPFPFTESRDAAEEIQGKCSTRVEFTVNTGLCTE